MCGVTIFPKIKLYKLTKECKKRDQTWAGIPGNDRKNDNIGHKKQIPIVNLSRIYEFRFPRVLPLPELTL